MRTSLFTAVAAMIAGGSVGIPGTAKADVTVMMSGGFALAYQEVLPELERRTKIKVVTTSGASQGTGPTTIKAQLKRGARPDVVILSKEGLDELIAAGRIMGGTVTGLATTPLGAAVRSGTPKPNVGTSEGLKETLLKARLISMPGSTSGVFIKDSVFPRLGIADKVSLKVTARGIESTAMLAAGESDIALGPVSELVGQPGIEYVGSFPSGLQLIQEFTAAIVQGSSHLDDAKRLIAFLSSPDVAEAVKKAGMEQVRR